MVYAVPETQVAALPRGWMPDAPGRTPFANDPINVMNVYAIDPATPRVVSTVAPPAWTTAAPAMAKASGIRRSTRP